MAVLWLPGLARPVPIADGGTGQASATAAFDALAPTTTQGDLIYHNGTDNVRLAKGTAGQVLKMNSGATAPEWGRAAGDNIGIGSGASAGYSPTDATAFYFGLITNPGLNPVTTAPTAVGPIYASVPANCTVIAVHMAIIVGGVLGSGETGSMHLRVNNTTDNLVFNNNLAWTAVSANFAATGLSIALAAGDWWCLKITPPTWATNPTATYYFGQVVVTFP